MCDDVMMNNCLKKGRRWNADKCLCEETMIEGHKDEGVDGERITVFDEDLKSKGIFLFMLQHL